MSILTQYLKPEYVYFDQIERVTDFDMKIKMIGSDKTKSMFFIWPVIC